MKILNKTRLKTKHSAAAVHALIASVTIGTSEAIPRKHVVKKARPVK
ncbi:MAG: hypothetical protein ACUZ77_02765 [Candidatus Brocadiales bacterium]